MIFTKEGEPTLTAEPLDSSLRVVRGTPDGRPAEAVLRSLWSRAQRRAPDEEGRARVASVLQLRHGPAAASTGEFAPSPSDPFLVVDGSLTICALSRVAEELLGITETEAVNRTIGEFLVPGDSEAPTSENLGALLAWAGARRCPRKERRGPSDQHLRRALLGTVGPCGPPRARCLCLPTRAESSPPPLKLHVEPFRVVQTRPTAWGQTGTDSAFTWRTTTRFTARHRSRDQGAPWFELVGSTGDGREALEEFVN